MIMRELSVFVDESSDFGIYDHHCPYYILTFVFHDQRISIDNELSVLDEKTKRSGLGEQAVHTGPIIRQEKEYYSMEFSERQRIMKYLMSFFRRVDIRCKIIHVRKKHMDDEIQLISELSKLLLRFIVDHYNYFLSFDAVKIYYDNGQIPVTKILYSVFSATLKNVQFKKAVIPSRYRLFQLADMLCSMELVRMRKEDHALSKSELRLFGEPRIIRNRYLKIIDKKMLD